MLGIRVGKTHFRIFGHAGECTSEKNVDKEDGIDSPAVSIEQRSKIAFAKFCPGNEAERARNEKKYDNDHKEKLPPGKGEDSFED